MMKRVLFFLILIFSAVHAVLSKKEQLFIECHSVSQVKKTILDDFFISLDPILVKLINGNHVEGGPEFLIELFERQGFFVHALHHCQLDHPDSDNRPARVILSHEDLPDDIIKIGFDWKRPRKNIARILQANKINKIIDDPDNNIKTIGKIEKKIYRRVDYSRDIGHELNDFNYVVISPKKDGNLIKKKNKKRPKGMSKEDNLVFKSYQQKCDLAIIMKLSKYSDIYWENFIIDKDGVMYIIDTESKRQVVTQLWKEAFDT